VQAVNVAQQQAGYKPDLSFSSELVTALEATDAALGAIVDALKENKLDGSTAIIISAKHGQAPIDPATVHYPSFALVIAAGYAGMPAHRASQLTCI